MLSRWAQRVAAFLGLGAVDGKPETPGGAGEAEAARYLERIGFKVLGRNLKCRLGEIDILAMAPDGRTVVVVEVKTRQDGPGTPARYDATRPEERVGRAKQRKLTALASWAVRRYRLEKHPVRFDVIGVDLKDDGKHDVRHYPCAFESHV